MSGLIGGLIFGVIGQGSGLPMKLIFGLARRTDRRGDRRFRGWLTKSYYFGRDYELELESVSEEDYSWLDRRADSAR